MRLRLALGAALVSLVAVSACGTSGLAFKQDKRVDIVAPRDRAKVKLPVEISWTAKNVNEGFAVLVDQAPPRPGRTLGSIFHGTDTCRGKEGRALCEQTSFLNQRNVFRTTENRFVVDQVPRLIGNDRKRQFHDVTLILVDSHGRRVGESAWSVQIEVPKAVH